MPVKVIRKGTNAEVDVSAHEAQAGLAAGDFILPTGDVRVVQGNRSSTVTSAELGAAIAHGWQLADDSMVAEATMRREESDLASQALGALETVAGTVSFGGTTLLEQGLGADPERMRARREGLGGFGDTLEFASALAPALATGGTGVIARGLGMTPAGMASGFALRAGTRAGAALSPTVGAMTRVAVPHATRGFVEGAAYGAGAAVDEGILDQNLTPEQILMGGGMGAIFGAAGEMVIPGAMAAVMGTAKIPVRALSHILAADAGAVRVGADGIGTIDTAGANEIARLLQTTGFRSAAKRSFGRGMPDEDLNDILDISATEPDVVVRLLEGDQGTVTNEIAASMMPSVRRFVETRHDAVVEMSGRAAQRNLAKNLPDDDDVLDLIPKEAEKVLQEIEARFTSAEAFASGTGRAQIGNWDPADGNLVFHVISDARGGMAEDAARHVGDSRGLAAATHARLERLRLTLNDMYRGVDTRTNAGREAVRTLVQGGKILDPSSGMTDIGAVTRLNNFLGGELFGDAGTIHAARNSLMHKALSIRKNLGGGATGRVVNAKGVPIDSGDMATVVRNSGRFAGQTKTELFEDYLLAEREFIEHTIRHADIDDATKTHLSTQREAIADIMFAMERQRQLVRVANILDKARARESGRSPSTNLLSNPTATVLGSLGGWMGGLPGAALGVVASSALNPWSAIKFLATASARAQKADTVLNKIVRGVGRTLDGKAPPRPTKPPRPPSAPLGRAITGRSQGGSGAVIGSTSVRRERADARVRKVAAWSVNPIMLAEDVQRAMANVSDVMPRITDGVGTNVARAVNYMAQFIPKTYYDPASPQKPLMDPIQLEETMRRLDAIEKPLDTFAKILDGTLTKEHVDTLRAVYPASYDKMREKLLDQLETSISKGRQIPLHMSTTLGLYFDAPVDPTLSLSSGIRKAFEPAIDPPTKAQTQRKSARNYDIDTTKRDTPMTKMQRGIQ